MKLYSENAMLLLFSTRGKGTKKKININEEQGRVPKKFKFNGPLGGGFFVREKGGGGGGEGRMLVPT